MRPEWCRVRVSVSQGLMHWHNEHNLFLARMAFLQVHHFRAVSGPSVSVCLTVTCFSRYVFFAALRVAAPSPSLCSPQRVKDFSYCPNSINSKSNVRFTTFSLFLNSFILPLSCLSPNGSSWGGPESAFEIWHDNGSYLSARQVSKSGIMWGVLLSHSKCAVS